MNPAVQQLAQLRILKAGIAEAEKRLEAEVKTWATDTGADRFHTEWGHVSVTTPKPRLRVTDRQAFTRWVAGHCPSAMTQSVNPAWEKQILSAGGVVDFETGECSIPAGLGEVQGAEYVTVRLDKRVKEEAAATVIAALPMMCEVTA